MVAVADEVGEQNSGDFLYFECEQIVRAGNQ